MSKACAMRDRAFELLGVLPRYKHLAISARFQSEQIERETAIALVENFEAACERRYRKLEQERVYRILGARRCYVAQMGDDHCDCEICTTLHSAMSAVISKPLRRAKT